MKPDEQEDFLNAVEKLSIRVALISNEGEPVSSCMLSMDFSSLRKL